MFSRQHESVLADLSTDLSDGADWKVGALRTFDFPLDVTTLAVEPVAGLLAVGTARGFAYIFGGPSVESKITLPEPVGVRLLQFSIPTYFLLCLDDNNKLHIYNLLEFGRPKLVTSIRFDQTNSITLSPLHAHAFLAEQNGEIRTYDLTCLRKSPYTMPNMWKLYEEDMAAKGVPSLAQPTPSNAVETVIHPRNLNLVFVAYSSGIILTDLTERSTVRAYELILPPGAPGGAGYGSDDILTHRRMTVTSITVHPAGHFFAVGYADGSIAFWAVEDEKKPLDVRTLGTTDVNIVDTSQLEIHLDTSTAKAPHSTREPIFKLSWSGFLNSSDPRGGETVLTILGGLDVGQPPGVTVFALPAFNPPEPPADPPAPAGSLHPAFRQAMRQTVTPKKSFFYETRGVVQDYLLVPRSNPHLGSNFDPYSILFIIDADSSRAVEACQFPPPGFVPTIVQAPPKPVEVERVVDEDEDEEAWAAGLLKSPPPPTPLPKSPRHLTNHTPLPQRTPFTLSNGASGLLGGRLLKLENDIYDDFVDKTFITDLHVNLRGGKAFTDETKLNELKLSKYQPRRLLMTHNRDLTIRFFDLSAHLLIPAANMPLKDDWPHAIPGLTIQLDKLFDDAGFADHLATTVDKISIHSAQVALEALECAVALNSGEILVYHETATNPSGASSSIALADTEIIMLDHIQPGVGSRLKPYFMLAAGKGPIQTFAFSNIGFLAVSYLDGSLMVVDMRIPKIILKNGTNKKQNRHSIKAPIHIPGSPTSTHSDVVESLKWMVSPLEKDPQLRVRLIAIRQSGHGEIYTLTSSGNPVSWNLFGELAPCKGVADPLPDGIFVLDTKTGAHWRADRARLAASFKNVLPTAAKPEVRCVLVSVGKKGARATATINGEKVAKIEWGNKFGIAQSAQVVEHMGSHALVVHTERNDALTYTLPHLELISTIQLPPIFSSRPLSIEESGDFIALTPASHAHGPAKDGGVDHIYQATYGTFFNVRRAYTLPDIDYACTRGTVPPQPQPVSLGPASLLGSWNPFTYYQAKSGDQIDELLGGPNRPIPEKILSEKARAVEGDVGGGQTTAAGIAAGAAAVQTNIYNRLTSAMSERGQLLGDLEERFNSLEEGSKSMVAQAKRLAAEQTAKGWFGF